MAIKITDNLLTRPLLPGGQSDGAEGVTRQFGNQVEQFSRVPNAPQGWGGVANRYAGAENKAAAQAAQAIASEATNVVRYMDDLRTAEEDSRAKLMYLEIDKEDAAIRSKLDSDPEYAKRTTTEQQSIYELERDIAIDRIQQNNGFSQPRVLRSIKENIATYKARSSEQYREQVVKPRVVAQSKINDAASDSLVIDKVTIDPTVDNVAAAANNILQRYDSPEAYAIYGAQGANNLKLQAIGKLKEATINAFGETLEKSPLAQLAGGEISAQDVATGTVSLLVKDQKFRAANVIGQLPVPESERLLLQNKVDKYIDQFAKASVNDHNRIFKEAEKERKEHIQAQVDTLRVSLSMQARNGALSEKQLLGAYTKLAESPDFVDNPDAQKRLYIAFDQIDAERIAYEREQRRLASDRKTRETIASMRMENGIGVSAGAADQHWRKTGILKSFFDGGNVLGETHLQEIAKAGAVPTSVMDSINTDLRSADPQVQQRGVNNLRAIKGHSSKTQNALYKDLPDEFSGVINRLESGWTPREALGFLTRQRPTPDVEKKLKSDASKKEPLAAADSVLRDHGWNPKDMSLPMRDELHRQWGDAYARAGGDVKLAQDLFRQDLAKNRRVGKSAFTGKIEQFPATNFASKEVVTQIMNRDLPSTVGKEAFPVYNGLIIVNGQEVPTYRVFIREDGVLTEATSDSQPFYMTREDTAAQIEASEAKKRDAAVNEALSRKGADREAELKFKPNADALKSRPLVDKLGGN